MHPEDVRYPHLLSKIHSQQCNHYTACSKPQEERLSLEVLHESQALQDCLQHAGEGEQGGVLSIAEGYLPDVSPEHEGMLSQGLCK